MIGAREKLIKAAETELVSGKGHFEMQAVAKTAGVSVGLTYHHFGSKSGLIAATVERFYEDLMKKTEVAASKSQSDWATREKARLEALVDFYWSQPLARIVISSLGQTSEVIDVEASMLSKQLELGALNIIEGQKEGVIPKSVDAEVAIAMIHGGVLQAMRMWMGGETSREPKEMTVKVWRSIASLLELKTPSQQTIVKPSAQAGESL